MTDSLIEMYDRGFERDSIVWIAITRENWLKISDRVTQLRQELSLAEEGLANYQQEVERLKAHMRNVAGWLNNGCEPAKGAAELLLIAGLPPPQSGDAASR